MKKSIIAIIVVLAHVCLAQSPFEVKVSSKKIILRSGGAEFSMNAAQSSSIYIKDHGRVSSCTFMPQPLPYKMHYFKLGATISSKVLKDTATVKRIKIPLVYTGKLDNVNFYLILEIHKDIPALIIDYQIDNQRVENLYFRAFLTQIIPTGGLVSYMMDYDPTVKFNVPKKRVYLTNTQWKLVFGPTGKGIGFIPFSKNKAYTFTHPRLAKLNYLGLRDEFGVQTKESNSPARLIIFPTDTHQQAKTTYEKIVKFKDKKANKKTAKSSTLNPFRNTNVLKIKKISKAPLIDGVLERSWKKTAATGNLKNNAGTNVLTQKTQAFLGYDNKNLYIAFKCYDDKMSATKAFNKTPWQGDAVEIYFSPDNDDTIFQIVGNISGSTFCRKICFNGNKITEEKWTPKALSFKVKKYDDKWIAEFAIPLADLNLTTDKEGLSSINLYRNQNSQKERSSFSPTGITNNYAVPEKFGTLIFKKYPYVKQYRESLKTAQQEIVNIAKRLNSSKTRAALKPLVEEFKGLSGQVHSAMGLNQFFTQTSRAKILQQHINEKIYALMPVVVWVKNPMQKLKPFTLPKLGKSRKKINISAFLNEYEYAAFAVSNLTKNAKVFHVGVSPLYNLKNKKLVIPPEKIKFREAIFVKPKNLYPMPDAMPLMNQINSFTLPGRKTHEMWVEVESKNLIPGTYKGKIFVEEIIGNITKEIPLTITILPVRLPEKKPFHVVYWSFAVFTHKEMKMMQDYYGNIVSGGPYAFYSLEKKRQRAYAALLSALKKHNITSYTAWANNKRISERQFQERLKKYQQCIAYLKTQGIDSKDFLIRHFDEPKPEDADYVAGRITRIKAAIPGLRFIQTYAGWTTMDLINKLDKVSDGFAPYGPELTSLVNNKKVMKILSKDKRPVFYYCNILPQKTARLFKIVRKTAWAIKKLRKDGLTGGGLWGFFDTGMQLHSPSNAYSMVYFNHRYTPYRKKVPALQAVPSRRLLIYREGLEDVTAVISLENILKNDKALSAKQRQSLKSLINEFNKVLCNSNDVDAIYNFRSKLGKILPKALPTKVSGMINDIKISVKDNQGNASIKYNAARKLKGLVYYQNTSFPRDSYMVKLLRKASAKPIINLCELEIGDYKFSIGGINEDGRVFIDSLKRDIIVEHTVK